MQYSSVLFHRIAFSNSDTKAASRCRCGDGCEIVLKPWSSAGTTTSYISIYPSLPVSSFNVATDLFHCTQFPKTQTNSALTWVNSTSGCWNSTSRSLSAPVNLLSLRTGTRSPDRLQLSDCVWGLGLMSPAESHSAGTKTWYLPLTHTHKQVSIINAHSAAHIVFAFVTILMMFTCCPLTEHGWDFTPRNASAQFNCQFVSPSHSYKLHSHW